MTNINVLIVMLVFSPYQNLNRKPLTQTG